MKNFKIDQVSNALNEKLKHKIDLKTKPLGALGDLETIAYQIGRIQQTLTPELINPHIILFAGDHGIANEPVSMFPQEVTYQMVLNIIGGGAAISVFSKQNDLKLVVVDSGVNYNFGKVSSLIDAKIDFGTKNIAIEPAMTQDQCMMAINKGIETIEEIKKTGCNVVGFGEMGIANTSSASLLFSKIKNIPIEDTVGRGTGLDDERLNTKKSVLKKALETHKNVKDDPISILSTFGGFEIAMMAGAMLHAAELNMVIIIDGFITTSALLIASVINPNILEYCIFSHQSDEFAHKYMLESMNKTPLINLNLRLGEGTGAALAYPIIKAAITSLNEMASFESAEVSQNITN